MKKFDWDPVKEKINIGDHKIDFTLAKTVFDDPLGFDLYDRYDPERDEDRYNFYGCTPGGVFLIVCFVYRGRNGEQKHLISARKGNRYEESLFREHNFK